MIVSRRVLAWAASSMYTTSKTPFLPFRLRPSTPVSVAHTTCGADSAGVTPVGHYAP